MKVIWLILFVLTIVNATMSAVGQNINAALGWATAAVAYAIIALVATCD